MQACRREQERGLERTDYTFSMVKKSVVVPSERLCREEHGLCT